MAERWYSRLSKALNHELTGRQAVVMYASHPEFEQTNVIEGLIDESTGGVTEGLRRRVVLPLAATMAETDHVLGHELVHAYQYDILGLRAGPAPLWFIEGMAEYLSIGPRSVQTSLWLRDAAIEGRLPNIVDLEDPRYFPYRFGHAFWAYIGGRYGDETDRHDPPSCGSRIAGRAGHRPDRDHRRRHGDEGAGAFRGVEGVDLSDLPPGAAPAREGRTQAHARPRRPGGDWRADGPQLAERRTVDQS